MLLRERLHTHMRNPKFLACGLLLLGLGAAFGQDGGLTGPVSGMVFDADSRSLRPVVGVPGAAYLGQPAVSGLDWASVAPNGRAALVLANAQLRLLRWSSDGTSRADIIVEEAQTPGRVAWSADSSAVAVYENSGRLRVWRTRTAQPAGDFDPSLLSGRISALAVENSGAVVLGVEDATAGGVFRVSPGATPVMVAAMASPGAMAFARNGRDLFVADRATRRVIEIRGYRASAAPIPLADETSGVVEPAAMAVSENGTRLFLADRGKNTVGIYDLTTRTLAGEIALDFAPVSLEPLSGQSLYLLKGGGGGEPFQVLSAGREPAVYFVPAERLALEER